MSDYLITFCDKCGDPYAMHLVYCPRCYPHGTTSAQVLSIAETPQKGQSKQRSKKVRYDGYIFDSQKEFERYLFLADEQRNGAISGLEVHPKFTLLGKIPKYKQGEITYTADFAYFYEGVYTIEDVKGAYGNTEKNRERGIAGKPIITEVARIRHKLLIALLYMKYEDHFDFRIITDVGELLAQKAK